MARYFSPPGTYECIDKAVLEDPTFTLAEFRIAMYLATKPDGWVIHRKHLADALGLSERHVVIPALKGLRERGLVVMVDERDERGRVRKRESRFRRDLILAKPQVSTTVTAPVNVVTTSANSTFSQVSTTVTDYHSEVIRPPSDYSSSSENSHKRSEGIALVVAKAEVSEYDAEVILDAIAERKRSEGKPVKNWVKLLGYFNADELCGYLPWRDSW